MSSIKKTFKYILIPAIALLVTMIIYKWIYDNYLQVEAGQNDVKQEQAKGEVLIGGPFDLVNQHGQVVTSEDFIGKYMLVYFGFTNCPMICPSDMANMTIALKQLSADKLSKVQPVFITIDPERDTVEQLNIFAQNYSDNLQALTGTQEQIATAANNYRIYYKKVDAGDLQEYMMDHSAYMYLMNTDGKYIAHYAHGQSADEISAGLTRHIK